MQRRAGPLAADRSRSSVWYVDREKPGSPSAMAGVRCGSEAILDVPAPANYSLMNEPT